MTLVRIVALTISDKVVRWASPGCKEWAEGLEREAKVIESDWAALRWAMGSTRVLLDRRPVPLTRLDEVPAATQEFVEGAHRRANVTLALSIINALRGILYSWRFFHVRSNLECAGCAIVVLGSILVGAFALIDRRRSNVPWYDDIYDDPVACAHLYKEQLKRADSLWNNFPLFLCWLFCMFGTWLYDRDPSYASLEASICYWFIVGTALLLILPSTLQMKHNNLRRIEEVDALLVERPSD